MSKYFIVTDTEMSAALEKFQKDRSAAVKARHKFADEHFPGWYELEHYEGSRFSVVYKTDAHGRTEIPDYMKFDKGSSRGCSPLKKTAKGKEIATLMDALPPLKGHSAAAEIINLKTFQVIDGQFVSIAPGVSRVKHGKHKGKFLISISSDAEFKAVGCQRIADVEAEAIKKPVSRRKKTSPAAS